MNISMFSPTRNGVDDCELLEIAKQLGFNGMELFERDNLQNAEIWQAERIKEKADSLGLTIPCLSLCADLTKGDAVNRIKKYILVAQALGSPLIHFTLYPHITYMRDAIPISKLVRRISEPVRELCEYAAERNVGCVVEDQGFYMNGIGPLEDLLDRVNHPNLGIVADLGNMLYVSEDPAKFVGYFAPVIQHVHVKDYCRSVSPRYGDAWKMSREGEYLCRTEIGTGVMPHAKLFRILMAAGYHGWYSYEGNVVGCEAYVRKELLNMQYLYEAAKKEG